MLKDGRFRTRPSGHNQKLPDRSILVEFDLSCNRKGLISLHINAVWGREFCDFR